MMLCLPCAQVRAGRQLELADLEAAVAGARCERCGEVSVVAPAEAYKASEPPVSSTH